MIQPGSETSAKQVGTKSVDPWAVLLEEVVVMAEVESSVTPACTLSGLNWISHFELKSATPCCIVDADLFLFRYNKQCFPIVGAIFYYMYSM